MISIIVAVAENGVIGGDNRLLWHISEDLRRFRSLTTGHPVVMGRKTYESLGRPLPNRTNVVVTRQRIEIPGCRVVHSFDEAAALFGADEELFVIGGALLALSLMVGSYIISVKRNYPKGEPFHIVNFFKQLWISIWALLAIVIVVVGVVGGAFTATESAAIAVIYSLFVSVFVYKGVDWKGVWKALDECVNTLAIVMILIATSAVFGDCLTKLHVPDLAAQAIVGITDNRYILILLLNVILLVLGMIMDMAPIILIATPILLPVATQYCGLDPIQFGIMMVLNCGIGLLTPPVGAVLFIGSAVAKRPMEKVVKATLPFYLCMIITLLLVSFWPDVSLIIPKLFADYVPQLG